MSFGDRVAAKSFTSLIFGVLPSIGPPIAVRILHLHARGGAAIDDGADGQIGGCQRLRAS